MRIGVFLRVFSRQQPKNQPTPPNVVLLFVSRRRGSKDWRLIRAWILLASPMDP
jgi:hypothetical protein